MAHRDIVVIGASAGGVEALTTLAARLPADFPASLFIVLHVYPRGPSFLPQILSKAGPLLAVHARNYLPIEPGRIYVAPPDFHLVLEPGTMRLSHGPQENRSRPAVDVLFRTAAAAYGPRVVGVVLTGMLDDGTAGLLEIKRRGGLAIAQDPATALHPDMPRSALENVECDYVASLEALPALLDALVRETAPDDAPVDVDFSEAELDAAEAEVNEQPEAERGSPSPFACPDCSGVLWQIRDGPLLRFRCRVGHRYSLRALLDAQEEAAEDALWVALRTIEENSSFTRRMAEHAQERGHAESASNLLARAVQAEDYAASLRQMLSAFGARGSNDRREGSTSAGEGAREGR